MGLKRRGVRGFVILTSALARATRWKGSREQGRNNIDCAESPLPPKREPAVSTASFLRGYVNTRAMKPRSAGNIPVSTNVNAAKP